MTSTTEQALATDRIIDITTIGRRTGEPRRIEIWFHRVDGRYYITGTPGARSWYANLLANPDFTFHLKQSAEADLAARAVPVEGAEKERILAAITESIDDTGVRLDAGTSPLVEVVWSEEA
ncbi:nitroreductase family deazaflavin-dependent oxidoreductase [Amnibacterium sp.]|uniref:nitroreductase family deazaflavin-dependent oxidoreductase n=1 Tax=Amnibacterium sp. TaxID=1872496 RepID=UPI003F7CA6D0